jgi:hypothetical protein
MERVPRQNDVGNIVKNCYIKVQGVILSFVEFVARNGGKYTYESLFEFASKGVAEGDFDEDILHALRGLKGHIAIQSKLAKIEVCPNVVTLEQRQLYIRLYKLQTSMLVLVGVKLSIINGKWHCNN